MTKVLSLLGLTVVLAIIKAVVIALALALLIALIYSFMTKPRATVVFLGALTLSGLAAAQPLAFLVATVVIAAFAVLGRRKHGARRRHLDHLD